MLNLPIAMYLLKFAPVLLLLVSMLTAVDGNLFAVLGSGSLFVPWSGQAAQDEPEPAIVSPGGGEALQGVVSVSGTTGVPGFRSSEVAFAYQNDPTRTWFLVQQSGQPVIEGLLASWDTTTIADGTYQLRLQVVLEDGQVLERVIAGLRVRNYSLVETSTPVSPAARQATITPTAAPLPDFQVLPGNSNKQPAPTNPAQLGGDDLRKSALGGTFAVFGALLVGGIYLGLRALFRRG